MAWDYASAPDGNVVQTAPDQLTGLRGHQQLTLALGFGATAGDATAAARGSLAAGFGRLATRYAAGWHAYLASLKRPPSSLATAAERREYAVSAMVLAASEDKTYRGAYVASPTMPWAWGTGLQTPTGPYHLVWSRDLYEIATALIADGDVAGARPRAALPAVRAAAARRVVPAELRRDRRAGADQPPARRGRRPDHPGLAARPARRRPRGST